MASLFEQVASYNEQLEPAAERKDMIKISSIISGLELGQAERPENLDVLATTVQPLKSLADHFAAAYRVSAARGAGMYEQTAGSDREELQRILGEVSSLTPYFIGQEDHQLHLAMLRSLSEEVLVLLNTPISQLLASRSTVDPSPPAFDYGDDEEPF